MIALIGNLSRDVLPDAKPRVGGGSFHGARALQRLRVAARVVARCAVEDKDALLPPLVRLGTPVRYVEGSSTATFEMSYAGDVRQMRVGAIGDTWQPSDLPPLPPAIRWVHVAPLFRSDFPAETLAAIASRRRLSLDGQGLVRVPQTGELKLDADFDPEVLRHVWVLKLADDEAEIIGDLAALHVREILVTHGSRGSTVHVGGTSEFVPAHPLAGDPTGAGDAFATAYIVARNAGFAPVGAAQRATAVVASLLAR
ncbi:MAG TPA: PfkB family carbohydrate kinase [Gaiellaceae bacterium]|nr:PfkB family carbohydrate kinase [Gaiellaceae bacterium]